MSLGNQHFVCFASVLESWVTSSFAQLGLLLEQLVEVAARWRDGSKIGVVGCFCRMVQVVLEDAQNCPASAREALNLEPENICMCTQLHLNSWADVDSFQELEAECGHFLQQQGPSCK